MKNLGLDTIFEKVLHAVNSPIETRISIVKELTKIKVPSEEFYHPKHLENFMMAIAIACSISNERPELSTEEIDDILNG